MAKKRNGPILQEERDFVKMNMSTMSAQEMADHLGRNPNTILSLMGQLDTNGVKDNILNLKKREDWPFVKQQFSDDEISLFEWHWNEIVKQFKDEIYHTEGIQIMNAIKHEILGNRALTEQHKIRTQMERLRKDVDAEYKMATPDKDKIFQIERTIATLAQSIEANNKEHRECVKELKESLKGLKSTRDQRLARVENSKISFQDWMVKIFSDKELQKRLGQWMEKMRIAKYGEKIRLGSPHKFMNGEIDRPFLNHETLEIEGDVSDL